MPEYTVKNVKSFQGLEGQGFECSLYKDGKKIGTCTDTASGGEIDYYIDEEEFLEHIKGLPTHFPEKTEKGECSCYCCQPKRKPGFHLENRYQDSGWEDLNEHYIDYDKAVDKAMEYSLNAIAYGMVRVINHRGEVIKIFSSGKECK